MSDGGGFGVAASAVLQMGRSMNGQDDPSSPHGIFQMAHQIPIAPPQLTLTAGAGALQLPDLLAVKTGYMWSVRRLVGSLFTAGTVSVYKNGAVVGGVLIGGEPLFTFPSAGTYTFGRGEMLLDQGDSLCISATGITGSVQINGAADCFERWLLPKYIG
jgi:hypothetical protein